MILPVETMHYAGLFGLLYIALSLWVSMGRARFRVHHGDGGHQSLNRRIRAHANFAEYVPFALVLLTLCALRGLPAFLLAPLCIVLIGGRVLHAYGVSHENENFRFRIWGMMATFGVLGVSALCLAGLAFLG